MVLRGPSLDSSNRALWSHLGPLLTSKNLKNLVIFSANTVQIRRYLHLLPRSRRALKRRGSQRPAAPFSAPPSNRALDPRGGSEREIRQPLPKVSSVVGRYGGPASSRMGPTSTSASASEQLCEVKQGPSGATATRQERKIAALRAAASKATTRHE